jgi:amidase
MSSLGGPPQCIAAFDRAGPHLNGYMYLNPNAADAARKLMRKSDDDGDDREGRESLPLYGVPVILKDNIATAGMPAKGVRSKRFPK